MSEGLIKDAFEKILKELQTLLTIAYLAMIGIGMLFQYHYYKLYAINIFEYADLFDYVVAPFENQRIFIYTLISILVPFGLYHLDLWIARKFPKSYSIAAMRMDRLSWYGTFRVVLFSIFMLLYLQMAAEIYGIKHKNRIDKKAPILVEYMDNSTLSGNMIGKTQSVLFIKQDNGKLIVIPYGSVVKSIELPSPNPKSEKNTSQK